MLAGGATPAAAAAATQVPCSTPALISAISGAASGATLSLASGCTYVLTAGLPTVSKDLTINGHGDTLERSTAAGTPLFTILIIADGTVTLNRLSFTNGSGAITANDVAQLNITGGKFSYNTAVEGPAINNTGSSIVQVSGSSFVDNTATGDGGAMYVYTALGDEIINCKFVGNTAGGSGGAYWEWSNGTGIIDSTFRGNTATTGGALYLDDQGSGIIGTVIHGNTAIGDGGGIFDSPGGTPIVITNSQITGNHAGGMGGGIDEESYDLATPVSGTLVANNSATDGGGINDGQAVYINYTDDTISDNHATGNGGGINSAGGGVLSFAGTTFSGNRAGGDGGGIDSSTIPVPEGPQSVSFTDSFISGNHAGASGGGVFNQVSLDASSTEITGNRAIGGGGIYDDGPDATATLTDSSPTGNKPDNCEPLGSIADCTD